MTVAGAFHLQAPMPPLVICADPPDWASFRIVFTYPDGKRDSGIEDASIVATHLMLAAKDAGVESCWLNFFDPDIAKEKLGLPENEEVLALIDLGFAAEGAGPLPNHSSRKPLEQTVEYR